jgi:hypothetical protein
MLPACRVEYVGPGTPSCGALRVEGLWLTCADGRSAEFPGALGASGFDVGSKASGFPGAGTHIVHSRPVLDRVAWVKIEDGANNRTQKTILPPMRIKEKAANTLIRTKQKAQHPHQESAAPKSKPRNYDLLYAAFFALAHLAF